MFYLNFHFLKTICCGLVVLLFLAIPTTDLWGQQYDSSLEGVEKAGFVPCGHDFLHEQLMKNDPVYKKRTDRFEDDVYRRTQEAQANPEKMAEEYTLPIVIHIVHLESHTTPRSRSSNPPDAEILRGIEYLNDGFRDRGTHHGQEGHGARDSNNPDRRHLSSADVEVNFCLATRDIHGNPTSGILRYANSEFSDLYRDEGEDTAMKEWINEQTNGGFPSTDYINFYMVSNICTEGNLGCGVGGYAFFPGAHGSIVDGVVQLSYSFNSPVNAVIPIHEVGHYLGLHHTWNEGCPNDDCMLVGDRVCDTPPDNSTNGVGCGRPNNTCRTDTDSGPFTVDQDDLYENYMDYASFQCQTVFTEGQKTRMRASLEGTRRSLLESSGCLPIAGKEVSLTKIISPDASVCGMDFEPVIELKNFGTETVTTVEVSVSLDNQEQYIASFSTNIEPNGKGLITLNTVTLASQGNHTVCAKVVGVNGDAGDAYEANNTACKSFLFRTPISELDFCRDFNDLNFDDFIIKRAPSNPGTFSTFNANACAENGTGAVRIDSWNQNSLSTGDRIQMLFPVFDLSAYATPALTFSRAYIQSFSNTNTRLQILASNDCGVTYQTLYSKDYGELASVSGSETVVPWQPESCEDWAKDTVDLSSFAGNREVLLVVDISASSRSATGFFNWGNNLYLDDFCVAGEPCVPFTASSPFQEEVCGRFYANVETDAVEGEEIAGWWVTKEQPISELITSPDAFDDAVKTVKIETPLDEAANIIYESNANSTSLDLRNPCDALPAGVTYYATPFVSKRRQRIEEESCSVNDLTGFPTFITIDNRSSISTYAAKRLILRDGLLDCKDKAITAQEFVLQITVTDFTGTSNRLRLVIQDKDCNSEFSFFSRGGLSGDGTYLFTQEDFHSSFDPNNGFCLLAYEAGGEGMSTASLTADLVVTYPATPEIIFPTVTNFTNCTFGTPVAFNCDCTDCNISLTVTENHPFECKRPSGSLLVTTQGAETAEYSMDGFEWQSSNVFENLSAGTYEVWVRDRENTACITSQMATLIDPPTPEVSDLLPIDPSDCAVADGQIQVQVIDNGTTTIEYSINGTDWQTETVFENLFAGSYRVQARNATMPVCVGGEQETELVSPVSPEVSVISELDPTSCRIGNGQIIISASSNGIENLEYSLDGDNWQSSNSFTGLLGNVNFIPQVRDAEHPRCVGQFEVSSLDSPKIPEIVALNVIAPDCGRAQGELEVISSLGIDEAIIEYTLVGTELSNISGVFEGLPEGTYTVITNRRYVEGCIDSTTVTIANERRPTINSVNVDNASGCGEGSATIQIGASGLGVLEYSINRVDWQISPVFEDLSSGTYTPSVRDQSSPNCRFSDDPITIQAESASDVIQIATPPSDCGQTDGQIILNLASTTTEYSIDGEIWQSSNRFDDLGTGTYLPQTRDAANLACVNRADEILFEAPETPNITDVERNDLTICGEATGRISINIRTTVLNVEYSLDGDNWQSSNMFLDLNAGNYQAYARSVDSPACSTVFNEVIQLRAPNAPEFLEDNFSIFEPSKCAEDDGEIALSAILNGITNVEYSLDGETWQDLDVFFVTSGVYTAYVRDAENPNCFGVSEPITVPDAPQPIIERVDVIQPSCGEANGAITIEADKNGNRGSLEHSIDGENWQRRGEFSDLTAGTYTPMVRLRNTDCIVIGDEVVLIEATQPTIFDIVNSTVGGCSNTIVTLTVVASSNGSGTLEYSLDGEIWQELNTFEDLIPGEYQPLVRNQLNENCVATAPLTTIEEADGPSIVDVTSSDITSCDEVNGTITIEATDANVEYSLDGETWQAENNFENLDEGSYVPQIRVLDDASCTDQEEIITISAPVAPQIVNHTIVAPSDCGASDGEVTVTITINTNEIILLEYSIDNVTWQEEDTFTGLSSGMYTLYSRNAAAPGCVDRFENVEVRDPSAIEIDTVNFENNTTCAIANGSVEITVLDAEQVEYSLDGENWQASKLFENLEAGNFIPSARNAEAPNCITTADQVQIEAASQPNITETNIEDVTGCGITDGIITITANVNEDSNLEYSLDNETWQTSNRFEGLAAATYSISVRSATENSCVSNTEAIIAAPSSPQILMVDASDITSCDEANGSILITSEDTAEYSLDGETWQTSGSFSSLSAGLYTPFVRKFNAPTCINMGEIQTISAPNTPEIIDAVVTNSSDCGQADGSILISANPNGVENLEYSLDGETWASNNIFTALMPDSYTVYVRDQAAPTCLSSLEGYTIQSPTQATITEVVITEISDCSTPNGSIQVLTNSESDLEYSLDGINWQSNNRFEDLSAGDFVPQVRNANAINCITNSDAITLSAAAQPTITDAIATDVTDCGSIDGTITISANPNGANNLEYSLDGGTTWASDNSFTGLSTGTYSLGVRNADIPECIQLALESIVNEPIAPTIDNVQSTNLTSCTTDNGTLQIESANDQLEYTLDGTTWQTNPTFTNLASGIYSAQARLINAPNCNTQHDALSILPAEIPNIQEAAVTDLSDCNGVMDGSINVTANGAINLEYSLDGETWQDESTFNGLSIGEYTSYVRNADAPDCQATAVIVLSTPITPSIVAVTTMDITSCSASDASIQINATGENLEYSLDGEIWQIENTFSNLAANTYTPYVRNATAPNCQAINSEQIVSAPSAPSIQEVIPTNITDCDASDGNIMIIGDSTDELEYSLDGINWQNNNAFNNLAAGNYLPQVRNTAAPDCNTSSTSIAISAPDAPTIGEVTATPADCGATDGSIAITATGQNLEYSLDGINWQNSSTFTGLNTGVYSPQVRSIESTNCIATAANAEITEPVTPSIIQVPTTNITDCGAADATLEIIAEGENLEYSLDGINWQNSSTFNNLAAGNYLPQVRNTAAPDCNTSSTSIAISAPDAPTIGEVTATPADCGATDGIINITATGQNLEYSLDGINWQNSSTFIGLNTGVYSPQVRSIESTNCIATAANAEITEPVTPSIIQVPTTDITDCGAADAALEIIAEGENLEYSLDGNNWQASANFTGLDATSYTPQVRNSLAINCTASAVQVQFSAPTPPSIQDVSIDLPSDCNNNDANITITATGENLEYSLDGNNWQGENSFTGLTAGSYLPIVRSNTAINCVAAGASELIEALNTPIITELVVANPSVCGSTDGGIRIQTETIEGSIFEYSLDNGTTWQVNNQFTGLANGSYTALVREQDRPNCISEQMTAQLIEDSASDITATIDPSTVFALQDACIGETIQLMVSIQNGTPPFMVTYFNGETEVTATTNDRTIELESTLQANTTVELISIFDGNGCGLEFTDQSTTLVANDCQETQVNSIIGQISTEEGQPVKNVNVQLVGEESALITTDFGGEYGFENLNIGSDYQIVPSKQDDTFLNGISVYDLVIIQKHILTIETITSPYKLIAADVDNSGHISIADLVVIRKHMLNIEDATPANNWRFIPADYVFPDPSNPWSSSFPELIGYDNMTAGLKERHFIAIKIGDINGNAFTN